MTIKKIALTGGDPVNLYQVTGWPVGSQLSIHNPIAGQEDVYLYDTELEPIISKNINEGDGFATLGGGKYLKNELGDLGCWARCRIDVAICVSLMIPITPVE